MIAQAAVLAASAAMVALMVGVAWLLGFRRAARIDRTELERLLALSEPGARLEEAAIAADGGAALARISNGKLMAAKVMGADISVRVYPPASVTLRLGDGRVRAAFADIGFPTLDLALDSEPPLWLADFGARGGAA